MSLLTDEDWVQEQLKEAEESTHRADVIFVTSAILVMTMTLILIADLGGF